MDSRTKILIGGLIVLIILATGLLILNNQEGSITISGRLLEPVKVMDIFYVGNSEELPLGISNNLVPNPERGITHEFLMSLVDKEIEVEGKMITYEIGSDGPDCEMTSIGCLREIEVILPEKIRVIEKEGPKIAITTNKIEYEHGEIVGITIKNNDESENQICNPFYTIERFEGDKWIEIERVLCPCEAACKLSQYLVLKQGEAYEYDWDQMETWCSDPNKISETISKQVPVGRYRVKTYAGTVCDPVYSNEFTIKKATSICGPAAMGQNYNVSNCNKSCSTDDDCIFTCGCGPINKYEICHDEGIMYGCVDRDTRCENGTCVAFDVTTSTTTTTPIAKPDILISTGRELYHSNELMNISVTINSKNEINNLDVHVHGINSRYERLDITRNVNLESGENLLKFEYNTPRCTGCAGISPGTYQIIVDAIVDGEIIANATRDIEIRQ